MKTCSIAEFQKAHTAGFTVIDVREPGEFASEHLGGSTLIPLSSLKAEAVVGINRSSLVLLGVVLSLIVHPGWIGLAGFVGAGLVFSGVTDTCGMAMLLARTPWNKR